jgi:hypothetical protein
MEFQPFRPQRRRSASERYLLACAIAATATLLRALADPLIHDQIPYFIYVGAVVVATWFSDIGGGGVCTIVSACRVSPSKSVGTPSVRVPVTPRQPPPSRAPRRASLAFGC